MTTDILLATYNKPDPEGAKTPNAAFIREQLDSILRQTDTDWRLLIRDDCSPDHGVTVNIIRNYIEANKEKFSGKIIFINDDEKENKKGNLGFGNNFAALVERSKKDGVADCIMFCDQDDIWHNDKVEKTLKAMKELEAKHGKKTPLLVHTDVRLVHENGKEMHNSFKGHVRMPVQGAPFKTVLLKSMFQGCTIAINPALAAKAFPLPPDVKIHDYWAGMVASTIGKVSYLPEQTMEYRQHKSNVYGGNKHSRGLSHYKKRFDQVMDERVGLAGALRKYFADEIPEDKRKILDQFLKIAGYSQPRRALAWMKEGFLFYPPENNIALFGGHRLSRSQRDNLAIAQFYSEA